MQSQRRWSCVLGLVVLGSLGDVAFALPHWKPKPAGPTTVYAPHVRHFIVVDPVPAAPAPVLPTAAPLQPAALPPAAQTPSPRAAKAVSPVPLPTSGEIVAPAAGSSLQVRRKGDRVKQALSPAQTQKIYWQQRVEPVPAYPWGWFGARRHTSYTGHRRFYSNEYDAKLLGGD